MDKYKIKVTRQAKEHLALIREYIATELKEPIIAKRILKKCTQYPCGALFFWSHIHCISTVHQPLIPFIKKKNV